MIEIKIELYFSIVFYILIWR